MSYWSQTWSTPWSLLLAAFALTASVNLAKKTSWWLFPIALYALLSAWSVGLWPQNIYLNLADPVNLMALEKNSMYAFVVLMSTTIIVSASTQRHLKNADLFLSAIFIVFVLLTILLPRASGDPFIGNPSMRGCLIACLLPFLFSRRDRKYSVLAFLFAWYAILKTDGSAGILCLGVATVAYLIAHFKSKYTVLIGVPLAVLLMGVGQITVQHQPFIHDSGRIQMWKLAYAWWRMHASLWFGTGFGTGQILFPLIEAANNPREQTMFLWLHNDWLQVLFEGGIVGLTFLLIAWIFLCIKSFKRPELFSSLCAFSAMACVNWPLRNPITALCLLVVCCPIVRQPEGVRPRLRISELLRSCKSLASRALRSPY